MNTVDPKKLEHLLGTMVQDLGAAATGVLVLLGDRLGIYQKLAESGPMTAPQLASALSLNERYLREWLANQAASHYISYDAATESFWMSPEQRAVFADQDSPFLMTGGFYSVASLYLDAFKFEDMFHTGRGIPWGDHHDCLFCGTAKFFRPNYAGNLVQHWLPALEGVVDKLERGARVADVGCGHGCSTRIMARAFPDSTFLGFDNHEGSITSAREAARAEGLKNIEFAVATAKDFGGEAPFDLIAFFDCLHDMGDPVGAAAHVKSRLAPGGSWMVVEPRAGDSLADNMNPVGRVFYAFSTVVCVPASRSQEVGLGLGAQAGEKRLRDVIAQGGFTTIRRAAETPFNLVLEARN